MSGQIAYIGLGSNLGDRSSTLREAAAVLDQATGVEVLQVSRFIETEPAGGPPDQGKYLNGVAEVRTTLSPHELLALLHEIEKQLGRSRPAERPLGPRTCDLDILLMGQTVMDTPEVTIPHPRMHSRPFVLRPLVEIAAGVVHPILNKTAAELLTELGARQ